MAFHVFQYSVVLHFAFPPLRFISKMNRFSVPPARVD